MKTPPDAPQRSLRADYLKLKSVLFDRVTGLPALPVLFDRLRTLLDDRRALGVLHVEIVNLDLVESLYGWQVFDRVVGRAADELREGIGRELPTDASLAVNGVAGDRFVAFVPCGPGGREPDAAFLAERAEALRERLEAALDDPAFAGLGPKLVVRTGHSLLSQNPFHRFERRVYEAVERARRLNDRRESRRERSWGEELQEIIRRRRVETLFQPVVDLNTGEIVGHEAFVRGPQDSMFEAPRAMFALSNRMGLSTELDRVCCEAALEASRGLDVRGKLFLNLSAAGLQPKAWRDETLPDLLEGSGLERRSLVVEISERGAGADPDPFVETLRGVKAGGVALALDDVGTGSVDLETMERAEPDYLKLDASLVRDIDANLIQQEVLLTLVHVADRIGASVVAEGVESPAEAEALRQAGARYAQGYLFGRPCSAATGRRAVAD